jgi:RND family efflux transporter MFP subunit
MKGNKSMRTLLYFSFAILLSLSLLSGCSGEKREADSKAKENTAELAVTVDVAEVKTMPVQRTVDFVGTLGAFEEAAVASKLEATVARVMVDMGDRVEKGRVIVKMDDEEYRIKAELAEAGLREALAKLGVDNEKDVVINNVSYVKMANAQLINAENDLARMKDLIGKGYIARSQLDDAQAKRDVARANLDSQMEMGRSLYSTVQTKRASLALARKQLADTEVRAPFTGLVSSRMVHPGDFAKVGTELVHIVKVDPVRLRGTIPEVSAPEIRVGQPVTVKLSAVPGKEYKGTISRISPSSSQESRSFMVEILIPNGDRALKPGYFAEASVNTRIDKDAMVVPLSSVVNFAGVNKLYVLEGGKAVEKVVEPGIRVGDDVEISGGVKPGDIVITTGMKRLYDGKPVSVRK